MRIKKLLLLMLVLLLFSTLTHAEVVDKRFRQEVLSVAAKDWSRYRTMCGFWSFPI